MYKVGDRVFVDGGKYTIRKRLLQPNGLYWYKMAEDRFLCSGRDIEGFVPQPEYQLKDRVRTLNGRDFRITGVEVSEKVNNTFYTFNHGSHTGYTHTIVERPTLLLEDQDMVEAASDRYTYTAKWKGLISDDGSKMFNLEDLDLDERVEVYRFKEPQSRKIKYREVSTGVSNRDVVYIKVFSGIMGELVTGGYEFY